MKITIQHIATRAGVSRGAVDKVIHNRPGVREEVRQRVLRVIAETGYVPIHAAPPETAAYEGAKKLCTQLTEELGRAVKVGMIQGVQGDTTNTARFTGFEKGAKEAGAEIVNVQYCNAMEDQARNCMDSLLSLYPNKGDLDVVFVCNDGCAQGAARAISEEGRGDEIRVCGYDGISSGVQAILDGTMTATVAQDPYNIGYQCVAALCKVAKGETVDKEIDTGSHLIDADNAGEYLDTMNSRLAG